MKNNTTHILTERLRQIDTMIRELSSEREEIKMALDVVSRYASGTTSTPQAPEQVSTTDQTISSVSQENDNSAAGSQRPDGIPTLWQMTEEALQENGRAAASDIVRFIGRKYWPGVTHAQVGPSLYRFVNEKRLERVGRGIFSLPPQKNEPPEGGSETEDAATSSHSSGANLF